VGEDIVRGDVSKIVILLINGLRMKQ